MCVDNSLTAGIILFIIPNISTVKTIFDIGGLQFSNFSTMGNYSILLGWLMVLVIFGPSYGAEDKNMKADITNYMFDVMNGMLDQAQSMTGKNNACHL